MSKKLIKELEEINNEYNKNKNIFAEPIVESSIDDMGNLIYIKNMNIWKGFIIGTKGTPYEGGKFNISIKLNDDYPFSPPIIKFLTKIYHPNINHITGNICLNILHFNSWSPAMSLYKVLLSVLSILDIDSINPDDPLMKEIADIYKKDKIEFSLIAKEWTNIYAK